MKFSKIAKLAAIVGLGAVGFANAHTSMTFDHSISDTQEVGADFEMEFAVIAEPSRPGMVIPGEPPDKPRDWFTGVRAYGDDFPENAFD